MTSAAGKSFDGAAKCVVIGGAREKRLFSKRDRWRAFVDWTPTMSKVYSRVLLITANVGSIFEDVCIGCCCICSGLLNRALV